MAEITRQEFIELRTLLEETYWMARGALAAVNGKESANAFAENVRIHCDPDLKKWESDRVLYKVGLGGQRNSAPLMTLQEHGLITLDDVASRPREEVAGIRGVGSVTMGLLDAAMESYGMSWAVTV